jgi:serine/threonine protein kinase/WD40 repeat protein
MNDVDSAPNTLDEVGGQFLGALSEAQDQEKEAVVAHWVRLYPHWATELRELAALGDRLGLSEPPPDLFPDFLLGRLIGQGGMGVVYEAEQLSLNRRVAVKVCRGHLSPIARERFMTEQWTLARLHQTHIVPIHTAGRVGPWQYFAMAYIEGTALHQVVKTAVRHGTSHPGAKTPTLAELAKGTADGSQAGPVTPPTSGMATARTEKRTLSMGYFRSAATVMAEAADAVQHAHGIDILHRDLKPSNLMVDAAGKCWVIDFGLAHWIEGPEGAAGSPHADSVAVTAQTRAPLGTPEYMSPEQHECPGECQADVRLDVWGLGVTLYELLTLQRAFDAPTREELRVKILQQDPTPPQKVIANIPRDLAAICLKALQKVPKHRYQTAADFAEDLRRWLHDEPILARPAGPTERLWRWCRRNPVVAWLTATAALLLVVSLVLGRAAYLGQVNSYIAQVKATLEAETRAEVEERGLLELARHRLQTPTVGRREDVLTTLKKLAATRRTMPEGRTKVRLDLEARSAFAASLGVPDLQVLEQADLPDAFPWIWRVALHPGGKVMVIGTERGPVRWVQGEPFRKPDGLQTHQPQPRLWYSADGQYLGFAPVTGGLELWDEEVTHVVAELDRPRSNVPTLAVGFQADMKRVWACRADGKVQSWALPSFQPGKAVELTLPAGMTGFTAAAFNDDGKLLAVGDGSGQTRLCTTDGTVLRQVRASTAVTALAWSPDNGILAAGSQDGSLQLWQADGPLLYRFPAFGEDVRNIFFGGAGRQVLACGRTGNLMIWDVPSGELLLTGNHGPWGLSRDGRRLAMSRSIGAAWGELLTPQVVRQLSAHRAPVERISWCSDNRHFASLDTAFQIHVWDAVRGVSLARFNQPPGPEYWSNVGIALSADAGQVAAAGMRQAFVWDVKSGKLLGQWQLPPAFGNLLAATGKDKFLLVREELDKWQTVVYELLLGQAAARPLKILRSTVPGEAGFHAASLTPDGRRYCWIGPRHPAKDCRVEVYETDTGKLVTRVPNPCKEETGGAGSHLSADGQYLFISSHDNGSRWFDLSKNAEAPHLEGISDIAPVSGWVATGFGQDEVRPVAVLSLRPGLTDAEWVEFGNSDSSDPKAPAFSPDGGSLAWGSRSGTITVVDLEALRQAVGEFEKSVLAK